MSPSDKEEIPQEIQKASVHHIIINKKEKFKDLSNKTVTKG